MQSGTCARLIRGELLKVAENLSGAFSAARTLIAYMKPLFLLQLTKEFTNRLKRIRPI
jgi:hypothetical protein